MSMPQPGTFCWNELATPDRGAAAGFFSELLGWTRHDEEFPGGTYTIFKKGETMVAGMMELKQLPDGLPPHWMGYIAVEDVDAAAAKVPTLGGKVHMPPTDIPGVGRFCVVTEPGGAAFSLITLTPNANR